MLVENASVLSMEIERLFVIAELLVKIRSFRLKIPIRLGEYEN